MKKEKRERLNPTDRRPVFDLPMLFRRKKQLVVWVDADRKVHSKAVGSITSQMKAVSAVIEYLQMYASMCQDTASKALNVDTELIEANNELKRQLKTANNTIEIVNKDMKRKAANRESKVS